MLRHWSADAFGEEAALAVPILCAGGVAPEQSKAIRSSPDVDGLGAGRKGRDPAAFGQIVQIIAKAKGITPWESDAAYGTPVAPSTF